MRIMYNALGCGTIADLLVKNIVLYFRIGSHQEQQNSSGRTTECLNLSGNRGEMKKKKKNKQKLSMFPRNSVVSLWSRKIPRAAGQLSPCITTTEATRLKPVLHNNRSHCSEKPVHSNEEQHPLISARESSCAATKTQCSQK